MYLNDLYFEWLDYSHSPPRPIYIRYAHIYSSPPLAGRRRFYTCFVLFVLVNKLVYLFFYLFLLLYLLILSLKEVGGSNTHGWAILEKFCEIGFHKIKKRDKINKQKRSRLNFLLQPAEEERNRSERSERDWEEVNAV